MTEGLVIGAEWACDPRIADNCEEVMANPTAPIRIRSFHSAGPAGSVGLVFNAPNRSLELDGFRFEGHRIGIRIVASCQACHVTLRNGTFAGIGTNAIELEANRGAIVLENLAVSTVGGTSRRPSGIEPTTEGEAFQADQRGSSALVSFRGESSLDIRAVRIVAERPSGAPGILVDGDSGDSVVQVANVSIEGHAVALHSSNARGRFEGRGLQVSCIERGAYLVGRQVVVDGLSVAGCEATAVRVPFAEAPIELRDVEIRDSRIGLDPSNSRELHLSRFRFVGNGCGMDAPFVTLRMTLVDGRFEGNGCGANVTVRDLRAENVSVVRNGVGWTRGAPVPLGGFLVRPMDFGPSYRPQDAREPWRMSNGSFEGNMPVALRSDPERLMVAQDNWWGSTNGPRPAAAPASTFGDPIEGNIVYAPFRTRP